MKITQGFVAAREDGMFLVLHESQSHVGVRVTASWTGDIEKAMFSTVPCLLARGRQIDQLPPLTWLPAEIRREVILKGYGV